MLVILNLSACTDDIKTEDNGTLIDEASPLGHTIAEGTFSGLNQKDVKGLAKVISTDDGNFILRLESFSAPDESNLRIDVQGGGDTVYTTALKGSVGNQNYILEDQGIRWETVLIVSNTAPSNKNEYGIAYLEKN